MTDAEWDARTSPRGLLEELRVRKEADQRLLRLFACACCRRVWHRLHPTSKPAVEVAEQLAEDRVPPEALAEARRAAGNTLGGYCLRRSAWYAALGTSDECQVLHATPGAPLNFNQPEIVAERAAQAYLVRDLFGNPFRPVRFEPSWRSQSAVALARTAYDDPTPETMAVLGDALEEAGCDEPAILGHCRGPAPHARGCWVVDLVLGKGRGRRSRRRTGPRPG